MSQEQALEIIQKIFQAIFENDNPFSLEEIKDFFAFDLCLPERVKDSISNQLTWVNPCRNKAFITNFNMQKKDREEGWMREKQDIHNLKELLTLWEDVNLMTTERVYDSENVSESDTIYRCENIFHSSDCSDSKNLVFCESCGKSEFLLASFRSGSCNFCIRVFDSSGCSNSYQVICSNKIMHSFFIQDCFQLYECMFCAHIANKRFCIANMQFEEEEYYQIKREIIRWILKKWSVKF